MTDNNQSAVNQANESTPVASATEDTKFKVPAAVNHFSSQLQPKQESIHQPESAPVNPNLNQIQANIPSNQVNSSQPPSVQPVEQPNQETLIPPKEEPVQPESQEPSKTSTLDPEIEQKIAAVLNLFKLKPHIAMQLNKIMPIGFKIEERSIMTKETAQTKKRQTVSP